MDTKLLHDLLIDDGFNLKNYDHSEWEDAAGVWTEYCMTQPSWLMDFWLDALAELHDKKNAPILERTLAEVGAVHEQLTGLNKRAGIHDGLTLSSASGTSLRTSHLGSSIYEAIQKGAVVYIQSQAPDWFIDVMGYASDMQEGAREDWEYENYKQRQLDEQS